MTPSPSAPASLTGPLALGLLHGLKLVAVAVVAQAVLGMAQEPGPGRPARRHRAGRGDRGQPSRRSASDRSRRSSLGALAGAAALPRRGRGDARSPGRRRFRPGRAPGRRPVPGAPDRRPPLAAAPAAARRWPASTPSTAPAPWCSAAAMWCCRCSTRRWCGRAGSTATASWPATARPRPRPARCSSFAAYLGAVMRSPPNGLAGAALGLVGHLPVRRC